MSPTTGGKKVTIHYKNGTETFVHVAQADAAGIVLNTSGVTCHGKKNEEAVAKDYAFDMPEDGWISVEDE